MIHAGQYLGLFKFFREREHLDEFLAGCLYCNTPEYYRLSAAPGVGDHNESCLISFRAARGDGPLDMEADGVPMGQASDMIVRIGREDGWLHCWAMLFVPSTGTEFRQLKADFWRLQRESGPYYAYLSPENSHRFVERISRTVDMAAAHPVTYYRGGYYGTSLFHKAEANAYQREFRFVLGQCALTELAHRRFWVDGGFDDIAQDCPVVELSAHDGDRERHLRIAPGNSCW